MNLYISDVVLSNIGKDKYADWSWVKCSTDSGVFLIYNINIIDYGFIEFCDYRFVVVNYNSQTSDNKIVIGEYLSLDDAIDKLKHMSGGLK